MWHRVLTWYYCAYAIQKYGVSGPISRGRVAVQQNVYSVHWKSYLEQHLLYNAFTKVATRRVGLHI